MFLGRLCLDVTQKDQQKKEKAELYPVLESFFLNTLQIRHNNDFKNLDLLKKKNNTLAKSLIKSF
jgi:hypothetical protein